MITIDGSYGEGGGQMLRTALALSAHTGQPFEMHNIRANRRIPGLAPQHLAGVRAVAQICQAETEGAQLRSTWLRFTPGAAPQPGSYTFSIPELSGQPSAGATTLLLQSLLLPLALAPGPSIITLKGGTHVEWAPPAAYISEVFLPTLKWMGLAASFTLVQHGWYPEGGGIIRLNIEGGAQLTGLDLSQRGKLKKVHGAATAANLPAQIPQRISSRANNLLKEAGLWPTIEAVRAKGQFAGVGIAIVLTYENALAGYSAVGKPGKPSDIVADEATLPLLAYHQAGHALDRYLPDQLLPFMALAQGPSSLGTIQITQHMLTNAEVIQHFIQRDIQLSKGREGQPGRFDIA